ncbi:HTH domain-containing protein [Halalkalibacter sp. APA_J-10(15)]|uniref:HTH domain-containing protein n=1 Tax=Halalkalibacter sp. APA_J-10(15) TaxID=2933805 RepID=UPI001FF425A6|nr:HTH domain-containing protein [Halalkalibacter sp. APA_J-10(15)]MCK0470860.1 helix-turn-helix domain-containing protein [Halalkalibacter sp. APA_J-10(15)]
MTTFHINTDRQSLKSFQSVEQLNEAVSIHMETLKDNSCKVKIMNLLSILSQHSLTVCGVSWLSTSSLATMLNVSTRTVRRYTAELESLSIIRIVPTVDRKRKGQTSNSYVILQAEKSECPTTCPPVCPTNLSSNQPNELLKDHNNVVDESNELILPTFVPERFGKLASLVCKTEKDIVKLYSKVQLAYRKCNLDLNIEAYHHDVIKVLKGVVYKAKYSKISNILGYFYKGILTRFDSIYSEELQTLIVSQKVAV